MLDKGGQYQIWLQGFKQDVRRQQAVEVGRDRNQSWKREGEGDTERKRCGLGPESSGKTQKFLVGSELGSRWTV